jgi:hypothetical protein
MTVRSARVPELERWRAVAWVLGIAVVVGVGQALIWARIAPGEPFVVYKDATYLPLPTVSSYQFHAVAFYLLLSVVAGFCLGGVAWRWRAARGTAMLLGVGFAAAVGAFTAYQLGGVFAPGVDPASYGPSTSSHLVTAPPTSGSLIVILLEPLFAVAVYTFLVAWNGEPDLDTDLPQPPVQQRRRAESVEPAHDEPAVWTGATAGAPPEPSSGRG